MLARRVEQVAMTPYEDCRSATDTFPLLAMFAPPDVSDVPGVSDWRPHMPLIRTLLIVQLRNIETEGMAMLPTSVYRLLGTREPEWTGAMTVRLAFLRPPAHHSRRA